MPSVENEGEAKHEGEANVRILPPQKYFFVEISYISYTRQGKPQ